MIKNEGIYKLSFPLITTSYLYDFYITIILIPLWWILGLNFIIFHFLVFLCFFKFFIKIKNFKIPHSLFFLFGYIMVYIFSIILNFNPYSVSRVVASFYNLSFWCIGAVVILLIYNNCSENFILKIFRAFNLFGYIVIIIGFFAYIFYFLNLPYTRLRSFILYIIPSLENLKQTAPLVYSSLFLTLIYKDYFLGVGLPRITFIEVFPTALGGMLMLLVPINYVYFKLKKYKTIFEKILDKIKIILLFLMLVGTFSRMAIFGFIISFLIVFCFGNIRKNKFFIIGLIIVLLNIIAIFLVISPKFIIDKILEARKGSSITRFSLYRFTIEEAIKKPFFGYGIKPRTEVWDIPIGSHSTYIGAFYKTGILGSFFLCGFLFLVVLKWLKLRYTIVQKKFFYIWQCIGMCIISSLIWMITDDLDATPIVCFTFFVMVGILLSFEKLIFKNI
ncbi:MAG: O-antigen ligase family protein [Endomicrobia bacterium]|nr:O-antigen ligase family protein [Endomicrobiia bacterium]